jgi:outer membrane protein assembly factor BamB
MKRKLVSILIVFFLYITLFNPFLVLGSSDSTFSYTNWSLFRVDSSNTGFTTASFPTTMEFSEFLPIQSQRPPIVGDNHYFLVEYETGTVFCYEVGTQNLVWKKRYTTASNINLHMGNGCIYSESTQQLLLLETIEGNWERKTGFVSRIYALHPDSGEIQWKVDIRGYYANSLTVSKTEVFVKVIDIRSTSQSNYLSIQHKVYSYNVSNGQMNWSSALLKGGDGYWSFNAPAFNDRYIIVPSTNCINQNPDGTVTAIQPCYVTLLDRATGNLLDTMVMDDFVGTSMPMLVGDKVYVVSTLAGTGELPNYLFCLSTQGNKLRQSYRLLLSDEQHDYIYNVNLAKYNEFIYFLDYSGSLLCISTLTGRIEWRQKVGERSWVGPYFCNSEYIIICTVHRVRSEQSRYNYDNHIKIQYIDPENGTEMFSNSVLFDGYPPHHLTGTEDHIWAVCGNQIAHFTPKEVLEFSVSPQEIHETAWEGDTGRFVNLLGVHIQGKVTGSINWEEKWIQCDTKSIHPDLSSVKVYVDPTGLKAGKYQDTIVFQTNAGEVLVSVQLRVQAYPLLEVVPDSVTLTIEEGTNPKATVFSIHNKGGAGLEGAIHSSEEWIKLSHDTLDDQITNFTSQYNTDTLPAGQYKGAILLISNGGNQTIPIHLHIIDKPFLVVTPSNILQEVAIGSSAVLDLQLKNIGGDGLSGTIVSDQPWILVGSSTYSDGTKKLVITLDARSLKAGSYQGNITFSGNDQTIQVPVTLQCIVWITLHIGSRIIEVNKLKETIEAAPYLFEKRTFVPVRKLVESLPILKYLKNAELRWDDREQKVTILVGEKTIEVWIQQPNAKINGNEVQIDPYNSNIAPQIQEGRTFLPLRFIAENLGYTVEWVASTQTIHLKYHISQN